MPADWPIAASGEHADHRCAFLRAHHQSALLVIVPRLVALWTTLPDCWPIGPTLRQGTDVLVAEADTASGCHNVFTGEPIVAGEGSGDGSRRLAAAALLSAFPIDVWIGGTAAA
jgi:maltooligosyltrehalose synthase